MDQFGHLAAPSWTAPANHLSTRRNHGSSVVSTRVLQHIREVKRTWLKDGFMSAYDPHLGHERLLFAAMHETDLLYLMWWSLALGYAL
jgi:hypothetical protein